MIDNPKSYIGGDIITLIISSDEITLILYNMLIFFLIFMVVKYKYDISYLKLRLIGVCLN